MSAEADLSALIDLLEEEVGVLHSHHRSKMELIMSVFDDLAAASDKLIAARQASDQNAAQLRSELTASQAEVAQLQSELSAAEATATSALAAVNAEVAAETPVAPAPAPVDTATGGQGVDTVIGGQSSDLVHADPTLPQ